MSIGKDERDGRGAEPTAPTVKPSEMTDVASSADDIYRDDHDLSKRSDDFVPQDLPPQLITLATNAIEPVVDPSKQSWVDGVIRLLWEIGEKLSPFSWYFKSSRFVFTKLSGGLEGGLRLVFWRGVVVGFVVTILIVVDLGVFWEPSRSAAKGVYCRYWGRDATKIPDYSGNEAAYDYPDERVTALGNKLRSEPRDPPMAFRMNIGACTKPFNLTVDSSETRLSVTGYALVKTKSGEVKILENLENGNVRKSWRVPSAESDDEVIVWLSLEKEKSGGSSPATSAKLLKWTLI